MVVKSTKFMEFIQLLKPAKNDTPTQNKAV